MNLDNSFDFQEFEKLKQKPKIPEETVSSITDIYSIAASLLAKSYLVIIPYLLLMTVLNAYLSRYMSLNFDLVQLVEAYTSNNSAYILGEAAKISNIFIMYMLFLMFGLVMDNTVNSAIAGMSKGSSLEKWGLVITLVFRKILPISIAVVIKIVLIGIGTCLFFIPGIIIWLSMLFVEYIIIFENKGFFAAWKRSDELMTGCKSNFITFVTIASFALIPVLVLKVFYNFEIEAVAFLNSGDLNKNFILALVVELGKGFIYSIYFCGTCLLYMKRTQVFNSLEMENKNAE